MMIPVSLRSRRASRATSSLLALAAMTLSGACSTSPAPEDASAESAADVASADSADAERADRASDATVADSIDDRPTIEPDVSVADAAPADSGERDAGAMDASAMDASAMDASAMDASAMDASAMDASAMDAGAVDARPDSAPDVSCPGTQVSCGGRCVDTQTDILNCGACATACPAPPSGTAACIAGRCGATPGSQVTASIGAGAAMQLGQPALALTMVVATTGVYPSRDALGGGSSIGMVHLFAADFGPNGAPLARGQVLSIASNTALFSLLGTNYGGNGTTNFALPNLEERFLVGAGAGPGLPAAPLGVAFGNNSVTLTVATMASHSHLLVDGVTRTTAAGRGDAVDLRAPSLPLTAWMATEGVYPTESTGTSMPFLGQIRWFAGSFTPTSGWVPADGRTLSIAENSALYSILGTTYGGDGRMTFAVPDLRGRVPIGTGAMPGGPTIILGQTVGQGSTMITTPQLAAHQHGLAGGGVTQIAGASQPVSMYQPSLGVTWLIALQGIYPARDGGGSFNGDIPTLAEVIAFAGTFAPRGFAKAEGQLLPISSNTALFSLLGTQFGGDGRTTFALPDLRGRGPIGAGATAPVGARLGAPTRTIAVNNLPAHTHMY